MLRNVVDTVQRPCKHQWGTLIQKKQNKRGPKRLHHKTRHTYGCDLICHLCCLREASTATMPAARSPASADSRNKLEDLSGIQVEPGQNPYEALIGVCQNRPVSYILFQDLDGCSGSGWVPPR